MARLPFRPTRLPRPRPVPTVSPTPAPTAAPNNAFTLTTNIETLPAAGVTAAANAVFTAPAGVTPQGVQANTLQSGDVLNGSGQQNVLNATFVTAGVIAPTINNIPTVNVQALAAFDLTAPTPTSLNLGASTGITTIGDVNSVANVAITGVRSALTTLNKSGGISRNTEVIFQNNVLTGTSNAVAVNLDGIDGGNIRLEASTPTSTNGYETFNVNTVSASSIGRLISGGSLDNINVSGANLSIRGAAGQDALERQLLNFNASAQTGSITVGRIDNGVGLTQGASVVNASAEDLTFVGSNNGTTLFVEAASLAQGDVLNGGAGAGGNLVLTGAARNAGTGSTAVQGNNSAFTATGFETLTITDTAGNGVAARDIANPANFNLANVSGVSTVQLGTASNAVVGLTNLQYTSPLAINVTGNGESSVNAANGVNAVFFGAFGETDTVNYTFGNKGTTLNSNNALNNGRLSLPAIENINLLYSDLSANTVLSNVVFASEASTASVRFINVSSASGEDARTSNATDGTGGSISLGTIGARDVRGGVINSNASVSATFNNREGASFSVSGDGNHNLNVENELASSTINANSATGDIRLAVEAAGANNGRAQFTSGSGDDILVGGNANDILTGNSGNDDLSGNPGIDVLSGGDNQDTLAGGTGNDVLTGGNANDRFVQSASGLAASANAAAGVNSSWGTGATLTFSAGLDIVTDFVTGDLIDVLDPTRVSNAFGAASSASFASANTFARGNFAGGVFTIASNGADVLLAPSLGTDIAFNPNTSFILLQGFNADLTAANFT